MSPFVQSVSFLKSGVLSPSHARAKVEAFTYAPWGVPLKDIRSCWHVTHTSSHLQFTMITHHLTDFIWPFTVCLFVAWDHFHPQYWIYSNLPVTSYLNQRESLILEHLTFRFVYFWSLRHIKRRRLFENQNSS